MNRGKHARDRLARRAPQRVGLFGLHGSGNTGNDAALESVLRYLSGHPGIIVDAMCMGPERVRDVYGIEAVPILWYERFRHRRSGISAVCLKMLGKGMDVIRTALWIRKHDVIIVPGSGVFETSLPLHATGVPYALFLICLCGKLFSARVALVCVGATVAKQRPIRWLYTSAARLAFYRSYRDALSREVMTQQGLDTRNDSVYADLVFGIPAPHCLRGDPMIVGLGLMEYYGTNDDRGRAEDLHASYIDHMKRLTGWLVDSGRRIRLLTGDTCDESAVQEILAHLKEHHPDLDSGWVVAEPIRSFADLARAMEPVGIVVAARYHNIVCALKLGKPAICISYSPKSSALMADMGLAGFCQSANTLDFDQMVTQFTELDNRLAELSHMLTERCVTQQNRVGQQFAALSQLLFGPDASSRIAGLREPLTEAGRKPIQLEDEMHADPRQDGGTDEKV